MRTKKNLNYITSASLFLLLFFCFAISKAQAVCPVCTLAVGAGIGIAEEFGVDDTIIGLWVGGLTVSLIFWTIDWLLKKNLKSDWMKYATVIAYLVLVILPLFFLKVKGYPIIGKELNKLWGIDKMLLGIFIGGLLFFAGAKYYEYLKKKNNNQAYFPFQKVAMPILPLLITSIFFYFLNK
jgi:hypothetical protein